MAQRPRLAVALLFLFLTACGVQPPANLPTTSASCAAGAECGKEVAAASRTPTASPTSIPAQAGSTSTPSAQPSVAATEAPPTPTMETPSTPAGPVGRVVLRLASGDAADQVGITPDAAPPAFRVAADGSIRIMDAVHRRISFFAQQADGSMQLVQTVDLGALKQPLDFAVTGQGDLYVLDGGDWTIQHFTLSGRLLDSFSIAPEHHDTFRQISLTAEGWLMGIDDNNSYALLAPQGPLPTDVQRSMQHPGLATVRTNARFIAERSGDTARLTIDSIIAGLVTPTSIEIAPGSGTPRFLDVNQGMQPYVMWQDGTRREVRRYGVEGNLLGVLQLPSGTCREIERSVYVDRAGDVYAMCVDDAGLSITRYTMTDATGQPLPPTETLATAAPWAPQNLQSAPG